MAGSRQAVHLGPFLDLPPIATGCYGVAKELRVNSGRSNVASPTEEVNNEQSEAIGSKHGNQRQESKANLLIKK